MQAADNSGIQLLNSNPESEVVGEAHGGLLALAGGGQTQYNLGSYSDGGRLLRGPGDGVL
jgi:hypothetical protein